jgi:hypothetical protein
MRIYLDLEVLSTTSRMVHLQTGSQEYVEFILAMPTGARAVLDDSEVWRRGLLRRITDFCRGLIQPRHNIYSPE